MTPAWGLPDHVIPFVSQMTGVSENFGPCETMAVLDGEGRMVAGLVFHNFSRAAGVIEISAAAISRKWATRGILNAAMSYCMDQLGCQAVAGRTAPGNRPTRRLWAALGAQEYEIPRLRGRDTSEIVMVVTDDAWQKSKLRQANEQST